jgi:hypothetical protein
VIGSASETCPSSDIDEGLCRAIVTHSHDGSKASSSSIRFLGFVGHFLATSVIEQGQTAEAGLISFRTVEAKKKAAPKSGFPFNPVQSGD